MNPEQLRAFLERNKVALGAAGAAVVAGLAFMRNRKSDAPAAAPALPPLGSALSAGGAPVSGSASSSYYPVSYVGASGGYDSTSADLYNALQPQLEGFQRLLEKQASPIPVNPGPDYSYIAIAGDPDKRGAVYQVNNNTGTRDYLTGAEWTELGLPAPKFYTKDDPYWTQLKLIGAEAPNSKSWWKSGSPGA